MKRLVTLFTGQWADLDFETICRKARSFGYDGVELACWGDHFDVVRAVEEEGYCRSRHEVLERHGLECHAIANHLVGQAVCDRIEQRHQAILPARVGGDGDPAGVRARAIEEMKVTARAAARLGVNVVSGFVGSSIWHLLYSFPPVDPAQIDEGFREFAKLWNPILDVFDEEGVRFSLEVHPTEIAFDLATADRAIDALGGREAFGFNYDPSHLGFGHPDRFWDFRSLGRGRIDFESIIRALNEIGYAGPLSVEWEDPGMDREHGAAEAAAFVKKLDFAPPGAAFDSAFARDD